MIIIFIIKFKPEFLFRAGVVTPEPEKYLIIPFLCCKKKTYVVNRDKTDITMESMMTNSNLIPK